MVFFHRVLESTFWAAVREGQLIVEILLVIRHISQCQDYLCHQFVWAAVLSSSFKLWQNQQHLCTVCSFSNYSTWLNICKSSQKLKPTCKVTPRGQPNLPATSQQPTDNFITTSNCPTVLPLLHVPLSGWWNFPRNCWLNANLDGSAPRLGWGRQIHIEAPCVPTSILSSDLSSLCLSFLSAFILLPFGETAIFDLLPPALLLTPASNPVHPPVHSLLLSSHPHPGSIFLTSKYPLGCCSPAECEGPAVPQQLRWAVECFRRMGVGLIISVWVRSTWAKPLKHHSTGKLQQDGEIAESHKGQPADPCFTPSGCAQKLRRPWLLCPLCAFASNIIV